MPETKEMKESWTLTDIYQTQPRFYFRSLSVLEREGQRDKTSNCVDSYDGSSGWIRYLCPFQRTKDKAQGHVWIKPTKVDDLFCSPFTITHLILKG